MVSVGSHTVGDRLDSQSRAHTLVVGLICSQSGCMQGSNQYHPVNVSLTSMFLSFSLSVFSSLSPPHPLFLKSNAKNSQLRINSNKTNIIPYRVAYILFLLFLLVLLYSFCSQIQSK